MDVQFLALIIVCLVLAIVLAAYDRLMRRFQGMKSMQAELEIRARDKATKMIEEARDKAMLILNQANLQASGNQQELDKKLRDVAEKQLEVYKEIVQNISKEIETEAMGEIDGFKKLLQQETSGVQQTVAQRIDQQYVEATRQIEAYKGAKMKEFDVRAEDVAREFCKIVVGKTLTFDDQTELIKQALEEAKTANVF